MRFQRVMKRQLGVSALIALTACLETEQPGCVDYTSPTSVADSAPRSQAVPSASSGPGKITFVNSNPLPGSPLSGCGATVAGCAGRLKIVFSLRPDVDLASQRLRVSLFTADEVRVACASTTFDLRAGESFPIEVECPETPVDAPTPFRVARMTAETGSGTSRIEQDWNVPYALLP